MSVEPKYLVDVFAEIVEDVRKQYDEKTCLKPYYLHGHPKEILKVLTQRDKSENWKYRKYPLIALMQDFPETKGEIANQEMTVSPRLLILDDTKRNYYSEDRYIEVFKPILYPIYELLLDAISQLGYFNVEDGLIPHVKTDRLFWGTETLGNSEKLQFNDYLDAIDIQFNNLIVNKKVTC